MEQNKEGNLICVQLYWSYPGVSTIVQTFLPVRGDLVLDRVDRPVLRRRVDRLEDLVSLARAGQEVLEQRVVAVRVRRQVLQLLRDLQ